LGIAIWAVPAIGIAAVSALQVKRGGEDHILAIEVIVFTLKQRKCLRCGAGLIRVHCNILSKRRGNGDMSGAGQSGGA
jgi:hypothetical protein